MSPERSVTYVSERRTGDVMHLDGFPCGSGAELKRHLGPNVATFAEKPWSVIDEEPLLAFLPEIHGDAGGEDSFAQQGRHPKHSDFAMPPSPIAPATTA